MRPDLAVLLARLGTLRGFGWSGHHQRRVLVVPDPDLLGLLPDRHTGVVQAVLPRVALDKDSLLDPAPGGIAEPLTGVLGQRLVALQRGDLGDRGALALDADDGVRVPARASGRRTGRL